ncbi:MAG: site-2 protease family protein [Candidatus Bathyarchaeia archaeon]
MAVNEPNPTSELQTEFERLKEIVSAHFQIEEALIEYNIPTFYLKQPQETKQAFLKVLERLEPINLIAALRRVEGRLVLKILPKPPVKPSNILVNWILLFATIGTTFLTGYMLSASLAEIGGAINPIMGGFAFTISIMAIFGVHEIGHKLTANKKGIEATPPYFIPGPPPVFGGIGTFGAVIFQKSLPPNRDALFDVGMSGPITGFIVAVFVTAVGYTMTVPARPAEATVLPAPLAMYLIGILIDSLGMIPKGENLYMHPVGIAGWAGMLITMLNLLPAAMLDGGHIARSLAGDKVRIALTAFSIFLLLITNFWLMALFVLFMSSYKHPGPLDDVSTLSKSRKILAIVLVGVFVLSFPFLY